MVVAGPDLDWQPLGYEPAQSHLSASRLVPKMPAEQDFPSHLLPVDPPSSPLIPDGTLEIR